MAKHIVQQADQAEDGRRIAPAALRNTAPLIEALRVRLPAHGTVLEVASGTGQHASAFAMAFPDLRWIPSDVDPGQRDSITAWRRQNGTPNLAAPLAIDVAQPWPVECGSVQAVLTINLLHLIPSAVMSALFVQARRALSEEGRFLVYGPFLRGSTFASEGDQAFDASLRARDPAIGYKSVEAVSDLARDTGFAALARDAMPANNLLLSFSAI